MLTIYGEPFRHCDGITRRSFLKVGTLGFAGLALADVLRAEEVAGVGSSNKAVINIHLDGGPPQMDLIDPKPLAPSEIRGEFSPISTKIPGVHISELLPKLAALADRFVFIRSLVGSAGDHNAFQGQSGYDGKDLKPIGGWPAMGSVVAKLKGSPQDPAPPFVDLMQGRALVRNSARPGFLGPAYKPFRPDLSMFFGFMLEEAMQKKLDGRGEDYTSSLSLNPALHAGRLSERIELLRRFDGIHRQLDTSGMMDAMDRFHQQAVSILTSGRVAAALDLSREDPRVVARYTAAPSSLPRFAHTENEFAMRKLLLARRLIEAGVRCVSVSFSDFDTHTDNTTRMREMTPTLDNGLAALVTDLEERGMLDDVSIVAWGEFGRTPKINAKAGRDHWPRVGMALLAGGGIRAGQVIGATDRVAGTVVSRPVHYQDIIATLYHNLGIDAAKTTLVDTTGRPRYLLDAGEPLRELI